MGLKTLSVPHEPVKSGIEEKNISDLCTEFTTRALQLQLCCTLTCTLADVTEGSSHDPTF